MSIPIKPSASPLGWGLSWAISPLAGAAASATNESMESAASNVAQLVATSKRLVRRLFTIGENRLALLLVEVREERERLLRVILLALGVAGFGLLAVMALATAIAVLLWPYSPPAVLLTLTGLYAVTAVYLYRRLTGLLREWKTLSGTLDQLRKDRACLEKNLV